MSTEQEQSNRPEDTILPDEDKIMAVLAYVPVLCLVPYMNKDRSSFVSGHVNLGMTLFIIEIFALILRFRFIWDTILLLCIAAALIGVYHVVMGRGLYIPFLSDLFSKRH